MSDRRPWTWPWLAAVVSARAVLAVVVGLALWGVVPAAIGWKPTTVSTGSMLPRLQVGDVAVSRPLNGKPPTIGSVLLFSDPDRPGRLRMHRFVAVNPDGMLITRGDANPDEDSTPITEAAIVGIGTLRVPLVGLPVIWLREGRWLPFGLTVVALVGLSALAVHGQRFRFDPPDPPSVTPSRTPPPVTDSTATSRPGAALMAGLGLSLGAVLTVVAVPSAAAFADSTDSAASFRALPYFSCRSALTALNPYVWYRMDETSNTATSATDSSGNTRTGVYNRLGKTANATRSCPNTRDAGTAMTYTGTLTGRLSSPVVPGAAPNTFSVLIWFKTTSTTGGKLIGYGSSQTGLSVSYDRHLYLTDAGRLYFGVYSNNVAKTVRSTATYLDNTWHLAVGTLSTDGLKLYVDGELVGSDPTTTTGQALTNGYWRIAGDNLASWEAEPTSDYFTGGLDEAAVFTTALTADQVAGVWTARS